MSSLEDMIRGYRHRPGFEPPERCHRVEHLQLFGKIPLPLKVAVVVPESWDVYLRGSGGYHRRAAEL